VSPPGFDELIRQAQEFQNRLARLKEDLGRRTVEGSAGGGMVKVTANGRGQILRVSIERGLLRPEEQEMLEDLVCAAVNQAQQAARALAADSARAITGGMPVPGLEELFSG
jgi:hypothetical protein